MGDYNSPADFVAQIQDLRTRLLALERTVRSRTWSYSAESATVATASTSPTDLGGPAITLDVPDGALVALYGRCQFRVSSGSGGQASLGYFEPTDLSSGAPLNPLGVTTPSSSFVIGDPLSLTLFRPSPGHRTYSLRYLVTGGGVTGEFRNRVLWAVLI